MVFLISDVERLAVQRHALRVVELRFGKAAVGQAALTVANDCLHVAVQRRDDDAVVAGVRDEDPIALLVGHQFAGERESVCRRLLVPLKRPMRTGLRCSAPLLS